MKSINIKGKEYITVNERVKYLRENYKNYKIDTQILNLTDKSIIIKAEIRDENNNIVSSGIAMEKEGTSYINKTSHIENCETSAVGRALGFLGIGIDESIASADEVTNAINNQNKKQNNNNNNNNNSIDSEKNKINAMKMIMKAINDNTNVVSGVKENIDNKKMKELVSSVLFPDGWNNYKTVEILGIKTLIESYDNEIIEKINSVFQQPEKKTA